MNRADVLFLHPPSIYDFRNRVAFLGPISDAVPSTQVFDMYPLGLVSLSEYLTKNGYSTRIVNLAVKMLNNKKFEVEKFIRKQNPEAFCIDLHWLVHTQGSLEIARICKKYHPDTPVILGGLTSTYYHKEILSEFPQVDFIVRGDSAELPLLNLLNKKSHNEIENLTWRENGRIRSNPITYVPENLDNFVYSPNFVIKSIIKNLDFEGHLPYKQWIDIPLLTILISKGCIHNCVTCGGSAYAYKNFYCREKPAFISPGKIIEYLTTMQSYMKYPCFFLNDIRMGGKKYWREILNNIKKEKIDIPLVFELFYPAEKEFLRELSSACYKFNLEISPEDSSEEIRSFQGKIYTNNALEKTIKYALKLGCEKFDIFFMIGLGRQSRGDVHNTLRYIEKIMHLDSKSRIYPFISPYAPTIDPGSLAFENPDKYGFRVKANKIREQFELFQRPSWKEFFNYETENLTVDDIVNITYESALILYEIRKNHNLIDSETYYLKKRQVELSRKILQRIEEISNIKNREKRRMEFNNLKSEIDNSSESLLCLDNDLNWPTDNSKTNKILNALYKILLIKK